MTMKTMRGNLWIPGLPLATILACIATPSARADLTNFYWDANGDTAINTNWTTAANWDLAADGTGGNPTVAPTASNRVFFGVSALDGVAQTAAVNAINVYGLVFDNSGPTAITADGANRAVTIGAGGILINPGAGTVTFGAGGTGSRLTFTLARSQSWLNNSANALAFNARSTVTMAGNTLTLGGSGDMSISATMQSTGSGAVTKEGAGVLTLTGTNTYTGPFTLNDGRVRMGGVSNNLGAGTVVLNAGTLSGNNATTARTLANAFTLAGNITLGHATDSGLLTLAGAGTLTGNRSVTVDSPVVISGAIGDGGGNHLLTKAGTGTLTLSGANTYGGGTQVDAGTLNLANLSAMPFSGTVSVGAGATIALAVDNGNPLTYWTTAEIDALWANSLFGFNLDSGALVGIDTTPGDVAYASSLGSTRGMVKIGANALTLSGNSTFSGGVDVRNGTLAAGSDGALGTGTVTLRAGTALTNTVNSALDNAVTLVGNTAIGVAGGTTMIISNAVDGSGGASLMKTGDGTLVFADTIALSGIFTNLSGTTILNGAGTNGFANELRLAVGAGSVSAFVQNDGFVDGSGGNGVLLGNGTGASGTYIMNGGSLLAHPSTANRGVMLGVNAATTGRFEMVGGSVTGRLLEVSRSSASGPQSVGYFLQSGGTVGFAGMTVAGGGAVNSSNSFALLAISNGTFWSSGFTGFANGNDSTGIVYFGQGAQVTLPAFPTARGTNAYAEVTFDGGTLAPLAASTAYMTNVTRVFLTDNGATLDVPDGRNITVGQSLEDASGDNGVLRKTGAGVLTLAGANTYSGGSVVSNGTLALATTAAKPGTGTINVLAGGALGLRVGASFTTTDVDTLWSGGMAGVTLDAASRIGIDTAEGDLTYGTAQSTRGLVKIGAGTLTLTGDNTYAGGTEILNGILQIGNGGGTGAVGTGDILNNTALVFNRTGALAVPGDISGTGTLTNLGSGTVTLSGSNTFTGALVVREGTLDLTGSLLGGIAPTYRVGASGAAPGTMNIAGDVVAGNFHVGTLALGATGFVTQTAGNVTITGTLQLAQQAASLAEPTTYGSYTLSGGTLNIGNILYMSPYTNGVSLFRMTDGVMTAGTMQVGRDSAAISNTTAYYIQSGGTATVGSIRVAASANSYGYVGVTGGVFSVGSNAGLASRVNSTAEVYLGQGSLVTFPLFGTTRGAGSLSTVRLDGTVLTPSAASTAYMTNLTAVTITDNGVTLDIPTGRDITIGQGLQNDGASTGFLVKSGAGALALQGANTFSGGITLNEGRLDLNSPTALGSAAGVFTIASNGVTIGNSGLNNATNTIANNNPMVWNGDFSYTAAGARSLNLGSGAVTLGGDRTVSVLNNTLIVEGILDDGASDYDLTKAGAGRLALTAANTFSGALSVLGGALELSGNGQAGNISGVLISNLGSLVMSNVGTVLGDRIPDAAPIGMAGGTLAWTHDAVSATAYSETLGALSFTGGTNLIVASQAATDGTAALTFASLARSGGARAVVEGSGLGLNGRNRIFFTAAPATVDGLIPWMLLKTGTGGTGVDWNLAEYDGMDGLRAPAYVNDETTWAAGLSARPTADQTLTTQRALTALVLDDGIDLAGPGADRNLNLDAAPAAGIILQTGGLSSITNAGNAGYNIHFGANEGVFNTIGTLWITRGADNNATIRGTNGFLKIGPGTLILQSASQAANATPTINMLGRFSIQEGTLELRNANAAGGSVLDLDGGTLGLRVDAGSVFTSQNAVPTNTPLVVTQSGTVLVSRVVLGGGVTHTMGNLTLKDGVLLTLNHGGAASFNDNSTYGVRFDTLTLDGSASIDVRTGRGTGDGVLYATNVTDNGNGYDLTVFGNSIIRSEMRSLGTLSLTGDLLVSPAGGAVTYRAADGFANVAGNILVGNGVLASPIDMVRELGAGAGQVRFVGGYQAGISAGGAPAAFAFTTGGVTGMLAWGATTFEIGTFQMNEDDSGGQVTLLNALDLNSGTGNVIRTIQVDNDVALIPGAVTNTGPGIADLVKGGGSTLWLTGPLGYNGATRVTGGHLRVPDVASLPAGNLNLNPANTTGSLETQGTFTRSLGAGDNQVQIVGTATGTGSSRPGFSAFGGDLTVDIGGNGTGTGPALVWNSTYFNPEAAVVTNGAFFLNSGVANGTLNLLNSIDLNGTGEAGVTDRRFEVNASVAILQGAVVNNGGTPVGLQKRGGGILVLGEDNSYDGGTYVLNGTLVIGAGGTTGTLGAGDVTNRTGSALAFNRSNSYLVDNMIVGAGTVAQIGSGTLTLSANNSYTGPTIVSNGILRINGAHSGPGLITVAGGTLGGTGSVAGAILVQSGAKLAPGASPGIFTANGDVTLDGGSTFEVELNGLAMGTEYDHLAMGTGTSLTLTNPTLLVQLGFSPAIDDTFQIVAGFLNLSGTFNGLPDDATFTTGGTEFRIDYNTSDITLTVVPEPASLGVLGLLAMAALLRRRAR
jgi:autotransporter-associated beta strand protein